MNLEKVAADLAKKAVASRNFGGVVKAGEYADWATEYKELAQEHYSELKSEKRASGSDILKALSEGYSSLDPTSRSALAGAGLGVGAGALSGLAGNLFSGNKKKHYLSDMLGYGLLGGGIGAGSGALYSLATGNDALGDLKNLVGYGSKPEHSGGVDAGKALAGTVANAKVNAPAPAAAGASNSPSAPLSVPGMTEAGPVSLNPEFVPETAGKTLKELNDFINAQGISASNTKDTANAASQIPIDALYGAGIGAAGSAALAKAHATLDGPANPEFKGIEGRVGLNNSLKTQFAPEIAADPSLAYKPEALIEKFTDRLGRVASNGDDETRRKNVANELGIILDGDGHFKGVTGGSIINKMTPGAQAYRNSVARDLIDQPDAAHLQEKFREYAKPSLGVFDVVGLNGRDYRAGAIRTPRIHEEERSPAQREHAERTRGLRGAAYHGKTPLHAGVGGTIIGGGYGAYEFLRDWLSKPGRTPEENGVALTTAVDDMLKTKDLPTETIQALNATKQRYGGGISTDDMRILLGKMQKSMPQK
jgi:hypothetical protein